MRLGHGGYGWRWERAGAVRRDGGVGVVGVRGGEVGARRHVVRLERQRREGRRCGRVGRGRVQGRRGEGRAGRRLG